MPDPDNSAPHGTPQVPGRLAAGLKEAVAEPDRRAGAYVRLVVSGGVHGERYDFEYHVDAQGAAASALHDELHGRHVQARRPEPDRQRFRALAEGIDVAGLLDAEPPPHRIPPDSVVGRLEISDGEQTARFRFLADPEQAERARAVAPEPLRHAVDLVYESAAKMMGEERLRP
jgi:hypothetical protein